MRPSPSTLVQRVSLKNYKSIADCDVLLRPLTFLVGPNGAGKSNFLDALRFVADTKVVERGSLVSDHVCWRFYLTKLVTSLE